MDKVELSEHRVFSYEWKNRYEGTEPEWVEERSRRPQEHPDENTGCPRSGHRPATPDVVVGWLGAGQCGWNARASASTPR